MPKIGVLNAHTFGCPAAPGEPDWSEPDVFTVDEFEQLVEVDLPTYAATSPHMIVFEVEA